VYTINHIYHHALNKTIKQRSKPTTAHHNHSIKDSFCQKTLLLLVLTVYSSGEICDIYAEKPGEENFGLENPCSYILYETCYIHYDRWLFYNSMQHRQSTGVCETYFSIIIFRSFCTCNRPEFSMTFQVFEFKRPNLLLSISCLLYRVCNSK